MQLHRGLMGRQFELISLEATLGNMASGYLRTKAEVKILGQQAILGIIYCDVSGVWVSSESPQAPC